MNLTLSFSFYRSPLHADQHNRTIWWDSVLFIAVNQISLNLKHASIPGLGATKSCRVSLAAAVVQAFSWNESYETVHTPPPFPPAHGMTLSADAENNNLKVV